MNIAFSRAQKSAVSLPRHSAAKAGGQALLATALAAFALFGLTNPGYAQLTVDYNFSINSTVPDNGQLTTFQTLGGLATFTNTTVRLNLTTSSPSDPMWLGDMYATLSSGRAVEGPRTAVLLNRPGRDNSNAFGSSLGSLNVTLDDSVSDNVWGTTSSTGTYRSDGRLVNPFGVPAPAFSDGDRTATLSALNGTAHNRFTLLVADTAQGGTATLSGWGVSLTGAAGSASNGTMTAGPTGTMSINDGAGTTNTLGAAVVTTQNGSGGTLNVTLAGTTSFDGGVSGSGGIAKFGTGTLVLNSAGTYTGATTVNAGTINAAATNALGSTSSITVNGGGTLLLSNSGATNRVSNTAGITLNGGTFAIAPTGTGANAILEGSASSIAGSGGPTASNGLGALTLTNNSILDFGASGVGTLVFANFLPGGFTLDITNYASGAYATSPGVDGIDDRLVFATDQSGNLGQFNFGTGFTAIQIALNDGYFEITGIPEPSTWIVGILTVVALLTTQRRKLSRLFRPGPGLSRAARNPMEAQDSL